jgi:hypothetical protein
MGGGGSALREVEEMRGGVEYWGRLQLVFVYLFV